MWLLIIFGILIIVGLFSIADGKKEANEQAQREHKAAADSARRKDRIAAYADYLRRTAPSVHGGKSNQELNDEIETAMRNFNEGLSTSQSIFNVIVSIGLIAGVFFGFRDEAWSSFFVGLGLGFAIAAWLAHKAEKDLHKEFQKKGWDPQRLKV